MKNTTYTIEVYCSRSSWDYPEWHEGSAHTTLNAARKKKTYFINKDGWTAREIRIVEIKRKVIR